MEYLIVDVNFLGRLIPPSVRTVKPSGIRQGSSSCGRGAAGEGSCQGGAGGQSIGTGIVGSSSWFSCGVQSGAKEVRGLELGLALSGACVGCWIGVMGGCKGVAGVIIG